MIADRLRSTESAFQRLTERFGSGLVGHSARGLKALRDADAAVSQADSTFKEPARSERIASALARATAERDALSAISDTTDSRLQAFESNQRTYFDRVELDVLAGTLIMQHLTGLEPSKRAAVVRLAQDPRIIAAAQMIPPELGIVPVEDIAAARARLWVEGNPDAAREVAELETFRAGIGMVINMVDAGLRDLRDSARLQPVAR